MITVQDLFDDKSVKYGSSGERFSQAFVRAVNSSFRDLRNKSFIPIDAIESLEDEIDIDKDVYYDIISDLVDYHLQSSGEWTTAEKRDLYSIRRERLGEAQAIYGSDAVSRIGEV